MPEPFVPRPRGSRALGTRFYLEKKESIVGYNFLRHNSFPSPIFRGCLYGRRTGRLPRRDVFHPGSRLEFPFIWEAGRDVIWDVNKAETTLKSCEIFVFLHQNDLNKLFSALIQQYFSVILIKYKYEKTIVQITGRNCQNKKFTLPRSGGVKRLYDKNRPAWAGIPVGESDIPPRRDGTKNVPVSCKRNAINIIETYTCRDPE